MPRYEYQCEECERIVEISCEMKDAPHYLERQCDVQLMEMEPGEPRICRLTRILSTFGGKFGDTRRFHGS